MEELKKAALRVVEGRSDGLGVDFMSNVLKVIEERNALLEALQSLYAASVGCTDAEISARIKARLAIYKATGELQ